MRKRIKAQLLLISILFLLVAQQGWAETDKPFIEPLSVQKSAQQGQKPADKEESVVQDTMFSCHFLAGGGERKLIPSIGLREEFNDNIFLSASDEVDDFITTLSPGLAFKGRNERLDAELSGKLGILLYADNSELNAVDQDYFGRLRYQITPRLGMNANGGYIKDHRPDRDILTTGLVQNSEPRKKYMANISGNYLTGETTADTLTYRFERSDYQDREFSDSKIHSLNFGHTWNMSRFFKETIGRMNLGVARAEFETSKVKSFSVTAGAQRGFHELWSVVFDLGARYTRTEFLELDISNPFNPIIRESKTSQWSGVGNAGIVYDGEFTSGNIDFSHDVREAGGRGGTAMRTSLTCGLRRRFTEKFSGTFSAGYFLNKTDSGTVALEDINERTWRIRPGIQYDFTKDISFEAAYKYTEVNDRERNNVSTQNMVFARIFWQYPFP